MIGDFWEDLILFAAMHASFSVGIFGCITGMCIEGYCRYGLHGIDGQQYIPYGCTGDV